jgi:hypothetical protein
MTIEPVPARSAVDEPIMPPKNIEVTTLTCARPPRRGPTRARANSNRRAEMPPAFITPPASTNSGSASSTKRLMPEIMVCGRVEAQAPVSHRSRATALIRPTTMGTPSIRSAHRTIRDVMAAIMVVFGR